jgi:spectinomycin phosphotransferase
VHALADGWGLSAETLRYAPVGGGSYHWIVTSGPGEQWFVTVDDLDDKGWLGRTRTAVFAGLRAALDASVTLRHEVGLRFVAAPVPALDGQSLRPLGDAHTVAVFPFLHGTGGEWDKPLTAPDLDELVAMLAALHRVDPAVVRLQRREVELSWPDDLELALRELGRPWSGGPFAEPARELLAGAAGPVRRGLDALDRWARATAAPENLVITHGEPHPGNTIRVASASASASASESADGADGADGAGPASGAIMLIDWDTVGLAPPERDLWMVATETGAELQYYTELTGRPVDMATIELYRLRWALDDLSCFVRDLRTPHRRTPAPSTPGKPSSSPSPTSPPTPPPPNPALASSTPPGSPHLSAVMPERLKLRYTAGRRSQIADRNRHDVALTGL